MSDVMMWYDGRREELSNTPLNRNQDTTGRKLYPFQLIYQLIQLIQSTHLFAQSVRVS